MSFNSYFSVLLSLFLMSFPSVISEYRNAACNNASTYTQGSTYSANLDGVITDLFRNTPQSSGFNTSTRGQSPNQVYGLLQCIGNISAEKCATCSVEANNSLHEVCDGDIGGRVWMDYCFLRYDNSNFISTLDTDMVLLANVNELTSNTENFSSTTSSLLSNLSNKAYDSVNNGFAQGSANYTRSQTVYGVVQCLRDLSVKDCRTCLFTARQQLQQCCSRNQGGQALLGSCTVRYEIYPFFDSTGSSSSPEGSPSLTNSTPSPSPTQKKSSNSLSIILGVVGGIVLVLVICLFGIRKRVKSAIFGRPVTRITHNEERRGYSSESGLLIQEHHLIFSLEALAEATDNFHGKEKLGEGGFGAVYKGTTRDGKEIAVKKLSARSTQGKKEFMNEVKLVANVQHRNLVKLLGCCAEGDERLLVYEYLPNKSLDNFLFDPEKRRELDWPKRYNIIIGIARGLLYLHEDSQLRIIHRDIKANNILLDDKLNPKIADFGLARLFPEGETHIQTRVAGTYGYMAPEYAMLGQLSVKVDVYSFGVLLLEIVSGRKNTDTDLPHEMQNLLEWAWRLYRGGDVLNMVESTVTVRETYPEEQALRCIHVGLLCVQADAILRPAMSNVIMMISSGSVTLPNPTKPAFVRSMGSKSGSDVEEYEKGTTSQTSGTNDASWASVAPSVNETSVSDVKP
ncbi:hypothetical protein KI387_013874, partial [Taxus chinensis]